jgi:hypothetical protein
MKRERNTLDTRAATKKSNAHSSEGEKEAAIYSALGSTREDIVSRSFEGNREPLKKRIRIFSNKTLFDHLKNVFLHHLPNIMIFISGREAARWKWILVNKHFRACVCICVFRCERCSTRVEPSLQKSFGSNAL